MIQSLKRLFGIGRAQRYYKARMEWLDRWNRATSKSWQILSSGPATRARFERWQRNHRRLCWLIERKNAQP